MALNRPLENGHAKSGSRNGADIGKSVKGLENSLPTLFRNANPGIAYHQADLLFFLNDLEPHEAAVGRIFYRVGKQIVHNVANQLLIQNDIIARAGPVQDQYMFGVCGELCLLNQVSAQQMQIYHCRLKLKPPGFSPADGQDAVQKLGDIGYFAGNLLQIFGLVIRVNAIAILIQQIDRCLDNGERRAKFMQGHSNEA